MPKAIHLAPSLLALMLGCSALSSTAQAGWFSSDSKPATPAPKTDDKAAAQPAATLDDSVRQAQMLRLAGNYPEALNHLSQLMLVAADDPRVVSEYGKTLASMGRAEEAEKFLTRAQQLQPSDWTIYSALGVAYDGIGNQQQAQVNYERALALKPGEPSVLNNYALSRMLAKDPATARKLAERAAIANAATPDAKIARNIVMIRSMAPQPDALAVNMPAPSAGPTAAPRMTVASAPLPQVQPTPPIAHPAPAAMVSSATPRPFAANAIVPTGPQMAQLQSQSPRGVVMQPVPADPLAGPVEARPATHPPRSLQARTNEAEAKPIARPEAQKPAEEAATKQAGPTESLEARAEAIAKTLNKPGAIAQAKSEASKDPKPAAQNAPKVTMPVKAADVKPSTTQPAPRVLPSGGAKTAGAKLAAAKPAAKVSKDAIPGLRLSANAY